jgi:NADPH-dependent curcumin reductase CurA
MTKLIVGGADKIKFITEELGFDVGIDYKNTNDISITSAVRQAEPNGVIFISIMLEEQFVTKSCY